MLEFVSPFVKWLDNHKYAAAGKADRHGEHFVQSRIWLQDPTPPCADGQGYKYKVSSETEPC